MFCYLVVVMDTKHAAFFLLFDILVSSNNYCSYEASFFCYYSLAPSKHMTCCATVFFYLVVDI